MLLIDEIDRADEEFEGFLLELLADFQITIPELGTIRAAEPPVVVITSNRTREVHDALKRRCLYFWIDYPDFDKEHRIVTAKMPDAPARLAEQVTAFVQELRGASCTRRQACPRRSTGWRRWWRSTSRSWTRRRSSTRWAILLKNQEDIQAIRGARARDLLDRARVR